MLMASQESKVGDWVLAMKSVAIWPVSHGHKRGKQGGMVQMGLYHSGDGLLSSGRRARGLVEKADLGRRHRRSAGRRSAGRRSAGRRRMMAPVHKTRRWTEGGRLCQYHCQRTARWEDLERQMEASTFRG